MLGFLLAPAIVSTILTADATVHTYMNGNELLENCTANDGVKRSVCLGYLTGVVDFTEYLRVTLKRPVCVPEGVNGTQLIEVVVLFLKSHPVARNHTASELTMAAVTAAWCPPHKP
jgi:hypothetical protein